MKRSRLKLKLNKPANFRTNEEVYDRFSRKCKNLGQFTQDRINFLILNDLGESAVFTQKSNNSQTEIQTTLPAASGE